MQTVTTRPQLQETVPAISDSAAEDEERDEGRGAESLVVPHSDVPKAPTWQDRMNSLVNLHVTRAAEELEQAKALSADIPI
jgi:hypothetical protein